MFVVAVYDVGEDKEHLAKALSYVLGKTVLEARARLKAPGRGPFVMGVFGKRDGADDLAVKLCTGGFQAVVLDGGEIAREAGSWEVRRFDIGERELSVESADGGSSTVAYPEIDLILRGTCITSSTSTETAKQRSFSLGRAVLSGGLTVTKTTRAVREVTNQERKGFFIVYAENGRHFAFRENGLLYDSLGPARQPSRSANFALLLAELRSRCRTAKCDESLLSRAGQAALLGPSLAPEEHLVVATALLAKVLRGK